MSAFTISASLATVKAHHVSKLRSVSRSRVAQKGRFGLVVRAGEEEVGDLPATYTRTRHATNSGLESNQTRASISTPQAKSRHLEGKGMSRVGTDCIEFCSKSTQAVDAAEESPEVEVVEDEPEVEGEGKAEDDGVLGSLVAQLESVVGDNEEAVEILTALKGEIGDANAKVVGMEDQVAAMKDQYLRLNADFDNFRKRTLKEKENIGSSTKGDFIKALLPVLDNFDLAEKNITGETEGETKILTGYQNMHKQMMEILSSQGLQAVPGVGEQFDPNDHEAIMREENEEMDEDTIIEEFRKGYKIGDTLIRASMVKVSTKP